MRVSIVITTKNEEAHIVSCLKSIKNQKYPENNIEIIVVDNNSIDSTKEISYQYTDKVYNFGPERSVQRNFGVKKASGEYILYLDADMILSEKIIKESVGKCEKEDLVALYIPERIVNLSDVQLPYLLNPSFNLRNQSYWIKVRDFERSFYNTTVIDCVRFVRKDKFLEIGGFDENLTGPEDWDFDRRIRGLGEVDIIESPLYHNESSFNIKRYLQKKAYYSKSFERYIEKWGKNDEIIKKQFGFWHRYIRIFTENRKWAKLIQRPILAAGVYFLRFITGLSYLKTVTTKRLI